ncbi:MAG: M14 family metallopeptidase [Myxococcales bacterium]|nr:M14 family metallopeptidase [Myxococcales bacterium]
MTFVQYLADRNDPRLHLTSFGTSPQGRELPLLVLSTRGVKTPEDAQRAGLPVVLMLDGIHPGEVEGKEATLALMRDVLDGKEGDWLEHLTLVVVPLFNPDGGDALDPANRKLDLSRLTGQPGPLVGTRTQSEGINLNRDYMRQQTLEMRVLQQHVCQPWQPHLTVDNHATNGSVHRMQMTVDVPHTVDSGRREPIEFMRERLVPDVIAAVRRRGFTSGWYGNFVEDERALAETGRAQPEQTVAEGWVTYPHHPRFGSNYRGLTNRLDLLLECYSYLPFEERVATARAWQIETLAWAASHADDVRQVVEHSRMPPERIAVRYELQAGGTVTIPTYAPRDPSGTPTEVELPHLARFVGTEWVQRPAAYAVPAAVAAHLRGHGLAVTPHEGTVQAEIATVQSIGTEAGRAILESAATGDVEVSWRTEPRALPAGYEIVSTEQPMGAVAVYLCEPTSDDGVGENGIVKPAAVGGEHPVWRLRETP